MASTLRDKLSKLSAESLAEIHSDADRLHDEYLTLQQLRKAQDFTQVQLAQTLGIRQSSLAQMEKRSDLMLSTLRTYVEAMGGELALTVKFPGQQAVVLNGFSRS